MARLDFVLLIFLWQVGGVRAMEQDCTCSTNKVWNGWCDSCQVGYVASVKIESAVLFHAIDAHGHEIRVDSLRCKTCRIAVESDGFCKKCRTGFVEKQAYFSKLTYLLAKGKVQQPASLECEKCRAHTKLPGWCDKCHVGMVGFVSFTDKEAFALAVKSYNVLLKAIHYVEKCQSCAVAMAVDRKCRRCDKAYEDGKVVKHEHPTGPAFKSNKP